MRDVGLGLFQAGTSRDALPANQDTINGILAYYEARRFADVMETLREEMPLYVALDTDRGVAYVGSGREPVGEEEGS